MNSFKYEWKTSFFSHLDAATVGGHIEALQQKAPLTPDALVEDAKKISSPIHTAFNWDDTAAAHLYRKEQAGQLLRSIVVVVVNEDSSAAPTRSNAYVNVNIQKQSQYVPVVVAMHSPDMREQILANALRELRSFEAKYASLQELDIVLSAISEVVFVSPLTDVELSYRDHMVASARSALASFEKKYQDLEEVAPVLKAIRRLKSRSTITVRPQQRTESIEARA